MFSANRRSHLDCEFAEDRKRNAAQDALLEELFGMPGAELGGKVGKAMERKIRAEMMTRDAKLRELERKVDAIQAMCDRMWLALEEQRKERNDECTESTDCADDR